MLGEFINVLDSNLAPISKKESIRVHEKGLLHIAVRSLLVNDLHQVLLVQKKKDIYFSRSAFDLTISNDVLSDETPEETIINNLLINLNLKIDHAALIQIGTINEYRILKKNKYIDNTISQIFLINRNVDEEEIRLNADKINGFIWFDYIDFVKKFFSINFGGINLVNRNKVYYRIFQVLGIPPLI
jgi:isopentenyldiphosphate isomerase